MTRQQRLRKIEILKAKTVTAQMHAFRWFLYARALTEEALYLAKEGKRRDQDANAIRELRTDRRSSPNVDGHLIKDGRQSGDAIAGDAR